MYGTGSSAVSSRNATQDRFYLNSGTSTTAPAVSIIDAMNYSNTTTYKTFLMRASDAASITLATVGLWRSTAAINRVDILMSGANVFAAGSSFTLYGIQAA